MGAASHAVARSYKPASSCCGTLQRIEPVREDSDGNEYSVEGSLRAGAPACARAGARRRTEARLAHLERAHVLSQAFAGPHVRVHGRMLGYGLRRLDLREVLGQLARVLVAAPGSWLGRAPLGNTGGADVGILTPMPIPEDLQALLDGRR